MATNTNIRNDAYNKIKYNIINFHLTPGQKISEKKLSELLGLGRTPIREALIRIERDGLINVIPQSGTYISRIDMQIAHNGRFVRECIEPNIMTQAAVNIDAFYPDLIDNMNKQTEAAKNSDPDYFFDLDQEFHHLFYKSAKQETTWDWLQTNNLQLNRFRRLRLKVSDLEWNTLLNHHKKIVNAVYSKNMDEIRYLTHTHLHLMLDEENQIINLFQDYFSLDTDIK